MFLSTSSRPKAKMKVLPSVLGGGSMVHFSQHYDPMCRLIVVEIEPAIRQIDDQSSAFKNGATVKKSRPGRGTVFEIPTNTKSQYDVIYHGRFLKNPQARRIANRCAFCGWETLKVSYKARSERSSIPDGLVDHLNSHPTSGATVDKIRKCLSADLRISGRPTPSTAWVVDRCLQKESRSRAMQAKAQGKLDRRFKTRVFIPKMVAKADTVRASHPSASTPRTTRAREWSTPCDLRCACGVLGWSLRAFEAACSRASKPSPSWLQLALRRFMPQSKPKDVGCFGSHAPAG